MNGRLSGSAAAARDLPLPITIEEIGLEWLTEALRRSAPEATLRGFEIVDVRNGTCTKVRLRLELDDVGQQAGIPATVILKGGFEPHSRAMGFMHEIEVRGYRDVLPFLSLPSPACYFADYSAERQQGIVIIEDLIARGSTICSALKPPGYDELARRLSTLAKFHAESWGSAEAVAAGRWGWLMEYCESTLHHCDYLLEGNIWQSYVDSARGAASSVRFHNAAWMRRALEQEVVFSRQLPHCVLHGDTHPGNLYVDADGTPGFFDPTIHRGPAMAEVCYHMACALDTADRPHWERALVAHYLSELRRAGVEPPSLDEAMRQYGIFLARAYFIFLINDAVFQPEPVNTAYTARISAAMLEHDTIGLLDSIR